MITRLKNFTKFKTHHHQKSINLRLLSTSIDYQKVQRARSKTRKDVSNEKNLSKTGNEPDFIRSLAVIPKPMINIKRYQSVDILELQLKRWEQWKLIQKVMYEPRPGLWHWFRTLIEAYMALFYVFWTFYFICVLTGITDESKYGEIKRSRNYMTRLLKFNQEIVAIFGNDFEIDIRDFNIYRVKHKFTKSGRPYCELDFKAKIFDKEKVKYGTLHVRLVRRDYNSVVDNIPLIYFLRPTDDWFPEWIEYDDGNFNYVSIYDFTDEFRVQELDFKELRQLKKAEDLNKLVYTDFNTKMLDIFKSIYQSLHNFSMMIDKNELEYENDLVTNDDTLLDKNDNNTEQKDFSQATTSDSMSESENEIKNDDYFKRLEELQEKTYFYGNFFQEEEEEESETENTNDNENYGGRRARKTIYKDGKSEPDVFDKGFT